MTSRSWSLLSDFGSADVPGGVWECPDLFALGGRWVLIVSIDPAPGTSSATSTARASSPSATPRLDHGPDLYAAVTFKARRGGC